MRVAIGSIDVDRETRRALNESRGLPGLASRERVRTFVLSNGLIALEDLVGSCPERTCPTCGGTACWHDEVWVCGRCGDLPEDER